MIKKRFLISTHCQRHLQGVTTWPLVPWTFLSLFGGSSVMEGYFGWFSKFFPFCKPHKCWLILEITTRHQLLHVDQLWGVGKIGKNTFFCSFSNVFSWFQVWNHWQRWKMNKKGWKQLSTHPKAGQNTQHTYSKWLPWRKVLPGFELMTYDYKLTWGVV